MKNVSLEQFTKDISLEIFDFNWWKKLKKFR